MKRVMLTVAYDGTNYHGWQLQSNGISIEEVLNRCLTELLKEPVQVIGASRTDSGVHAFGNIAVFDTRARMPGDKFSYALNQRLPEDIRIRGSREVSLTFHPRKTDSIKTYEYRILNEEFPNPVKRLYSHFTYLPLDEKKMNEGAKFLIGEHDFKSFCSVNAQVESTVRTIYSCEVQREGTEVVIRISGGGFLYNMVRIIAGTLMDVGNGKYPPETVADILKAKERTAAGPTAPARGLTLISYEFPELKDSPERQEIL
ncbi:tRNA pseudouridine(38-40) synthase TruA [Eisenbergiella tayi]|uniref:tRNA pseudouridine synthase A n=1 Tax=Eisenbergiella tayi TaxID=1432052 RepID=A0A1E3AJW5_9FIRM|nr:tRNA pseudouridine(38-40) synthase TruA [Eisenbergiella tayi]ODM08909.1 tRNA pseudouridine synthase A [Eisenbergiella tayi]ODR41235.1 tRNA pseudouridine(38-40) synthase TruA [Eisenbergiella tayi]